MLRATGFDTPVPTGPAGEVVAAGCGPVARLHREGDDTVTNAQVLEFRVPDLGEGLEDATITGWSVSVDEVVELNQVLCTLETAKAEVEIPQSLRGTGDRTGRRRR